MDNTYNSGFSKVLLTPDPHYIPGYAGYCPQLKFTMGRTYGQLTAEMLTRPDLKLSSRLLLHTGYVPSTESDMTLRTTPNSNLMKVIPGYTGFIPKSRSYFACSYSEKCRKALSEFYQDGHTKIRQQSTGQDLPVVVNYNNQLLERPMLPLTPIPNTVISYKPLKSFTPIGNPYFMEDDNPHKYFISGFTGHVPNSRFLFGKSYSDTTNQALIQFRKQQQGDPMSLSSPTDSSTHSLPIIYPSSRSVVPSFKGHIPGYKFMYGHTFGQLSQNALEKSGIKRILQEKSENQH